MRNPLKIWINWLKRLPTPMNIFAMWISTQTLLTLFGFSLIIIQAVLIKQDPLHCSADFGILKLLGMLIVFVSGLPTSYIIEKLNIPVKESGPLYYVGSLVFLFGAIVLHYIIFYTSLYILMRRRKAGNHHAS